MFRLLPARAVEEQGGKKVTRWLESWDAALVEVEAAVRAGTTTLALVLGPNTATPREVYRLDLDGRQHCGEADEASRLPRGKAVEYSDEGRTVEADATRRVVRSLVAGLGLGNSLPVTGVHILVHAARDAPMPDAFLPKQGFRVDRKVAPTSIRIQGDPETLVARSLAFDGGAAEDGDDALWFQCSKTVKGLNMTVLDA